MTIETAHTSTYITTKDPTKDLSCVRVQIHVNRLVFPPIKMHGHKLTYWQLRMWFTFPIAVTVVFSLRLSWEHSKLSLSSSSIGTICSRELDILTNTFGLLEQQGSNRAAKQLSVTGVTSHVNKPEPGCQTRSQRLTTTWVRNAFMSGLNIISPCQNVPLRIIIVPLFVIFIIIIRIFSFSPNLGHEEI